MAQMASEDFDRPLEEAKAILRQGNVQFRDAFELFGAACEYESRSSTLSSEGNASPVLDDDAGDHLSPNRDSSQAEFQAHRHETLHIDTDAATETGAHFSPVPLSPVSLSSFGSAEPVAQGDDAPPIGGFPSTQQLGQSPLIRIDPLAEDEQKISEELDVESENRREAEKGREIPPDASRTRIDRRLVNPRSLEIAGFEFEERGDVVVVFQVLTKEEIQDLADLTRRIRITDSTCVDALTAGMLTYLQRMETVQM